MKSKQEKGRILSLKKVYPQGLIFSSMCNEFLLIIRSGAPLVDEICPVCPVAMLVPSLHSSSSNNYSISLIHVSQILENLAISLST
jgi:hypothetical protein